MQIFLLPIIIPFISASLHVNNPLPQFVELKPITNNFKGNSLYADIMNHAQTPYRLYDISTQAHETCHFISSELGVKHPKGFAMQALYLGKNRVVYLDDPKNLLKSQVGNFVPFSLRGYRFRTYVTDTAQEALERKPFYILNEAVAYLNGGKVAIESEKAKIWGDTMVDSVSGCLEFSIYAVCLAMAIEKYDPKYFENNKQFKKFVVWYLKEAQATFEEGMKIQKFNHEDSKTLLKNLRTSPDAAKVRNFLDTHFESVWIK